jgi:RimJ/RimL family protein N-acetyltransferase
MSFDPHVSLLLDLEDGLRLSVRALTPGDRHRIAEAFRRLSPEARYFRFWSRFRELNPPFVEELCSPDQRDHVGWAAFDPLREDVPGVGGASFWRLKDDPVAAEVSFTVADEYQGRGVGTLLLGVLWEHALSLGITRFVGHVLNENLTMRAWWDALGATAIEYERQWVMTLLLEEDLLQDSHPGQRLRERLAQVRAAMAARATSSG